MNKSQITYDQIMCECESAIDYLVDQLVDINKMHSLETKSSNLLKIEQSCRNLKPKFSLYRRLIVLKPAKKYAANIAEYYSRLQKELRELVEDKTPELVESYQFLKIPQHKKYLDFVNSLIDDANSYATGQKKVRVKCKVSFEKIVSKLKYKEFDADLKISSIDPIVIPQSEILFVFNTKYRDLFIYQAKDGEKFSVKGTTLQNFDEDKSFKKKIRKPEDVLNSVLKTTKLRAIRAFGEIKTKPGIATGRINGECILLRAI